MEVYREVRPLEWPPAVVAQSVFGDSRQRRRTTRRGFGLYRTDVRIDEDDGSLETSVRVPGALGLCVFAILVAGATVVHPDLRLPALWLGVLAVVVPLGHLIPSLDERPSVGSVTDRRISPASVPAFVAVVAVLWLTLRPALGGPAGLFSGCLLAIGAGSYGVATGWRTASVSTLWLAVAGLLPLLSTVATLALTAALLDIGVSTGHVLVVGSLSALFSLALVFAYCWLAYRYVSDARFAPLAGPPVRMALFAGYLLVVTGLCVTGYLLAVDVAGAFGIPFLLVTGLPLVVPLGGWVYDALETATARYEVLRNAERRTVDGTPVYVLDVDATDVRALSVPRGVLLGRPVLDELPEDELSALVAHERYHLRNRERALRALVAVAALPVGRNAMVAFLDYPARERSADRHAAGVAGSGPLVRALRRLEGLDGARSADCALLAAPYALLFGAVPGAASYPSVDDRVAAVTR